MTITSRTTKPRTRTANGVTSANPTAALSSGTHDGVVQLCMFGRSSAMNSTAQPSTPRLKTTMSAVRRSPSDPGRQSPRRAKRATCATLSTIIAMM